MRKRIVIEFEIQIGNRTSSIESTINTDMRVDFDNTVTDRNKIETIVWNNDPHYTETLRATVQRFIETEIVDFHKIPDIKR